MHSSDPDLYDPYLDLNPSHGPEDGPGLYIKGLVGGFADLDTA